MSDQDLEEMRQSTSQSPAARIGCKELKLGPGVKGESVYMTHSSRPLRQEVEGLVVLRGQAICCDRGS